MSLLHSGQDLGQVLWLGREKVSTCTFVSVGSLGDLHRKKRHGSMEIRLGEREAHDKGSG
jgi:hypothetical protein